MYKDQLLFFVHLFSINAQMEVCKINQEVLMHSANALHKLKTHTIKLNLDWHWLKGHAGHLQNEECDAMAQKEIKMLKK